ncbi:MAG TPA: M48 family metalloprotease, partial [Halanaerobiales bacterium]|nr:M48 family metalloprotease [Halanaerobiales bacterium]
FIEFFTIYDLRKEYNLSAQSSKEWLNDRVKSFLLTLVLTHLFSLLFLFLTNNYPQAWWLIMSIILSVFVVLLNYLLPVLILPLFYTLKSYPEGELKDRLMSTFDKLDIEIEDIYEINLSSKMTSANAAVIGMGKTRKILLSDNLADRFSAEEIEAVLSHEIGHHVNNDIYKNLLLLPFIIVITAFIVHLSWPTLLSWFGYVNQNLIISLPLLLLYWGILYSIFTPLQLYLSRKYERRADKFAFEVIDKPMNLGKAFAKLADDSLSRLDYRWWEKLYKASHPSIKSRIYEAKEHKDNND